MNAYTAQATQNYQRTQVGTASPEKLVLMLYDGAVRKLNLACTELLKGNDTEFNIQVVKVQKIVSELMMALDHESGEEVAKNLARIYEYMLRQLALALIRRDSDLSEEVRGLLEELREGWQGVIQKTLATDAAQGTGTDGQLPVSQDAKVLPIPHQNLLEPVASSLNVAG